MISCLNKHFARTLILLCWMQWNKKGEITNFGFWASYKHKKLLLRFFLKDIVVLLLWLLYQKTSFIYLVPTETSMMLLSIHRIKQDVVLSIHPFSRTLQFENTYIIYTSFLVSLKETCMCIYLYIGEKTETILSSL